MTQKEQLDKVAYEIGALGKLVIDDCDSTDDLIEMARLLIRIGDRHGVPVATGVLEVLSDLKEFNNHARWLTKKLEDMQ